MNHYEVLKQIEYYKESLIGIRRQIDTLIENLVKDRYAVEEEIRYHMRESQIRDALARQ